MSARRTTSRSVLVWGGMDGAVAAGWLHDGGYVWVQSWASPELAAVGVASAARWGVEPGQVPVDDGPGMEGITLLRCLLGLAEQESIRGVMREYWPLPVADTDQLWQVVASQLSTSAVLQSVSWPSLEVTTRQVDPDPELARMAQEAARDQAARAYRRRAREAVGRELGTLRARQAAVAAQREAAARERVRLGERPLGRAELCDAMVDGACLGHLHEWSDRLRTALEAWLEHVDGHHEARPLLSILRRTVEKRRAVRSPFAGILEAPEVINDLFGRHGRAASEDAQTYGDGLAALIRDAADALYTRLPRPVMWDELIDRGAWPIAPAAPDYEEDW